MNNPIPTLKYETEVVGMGADQKRHFYWLDLIRFLAAFAVLACHFRGAFFVDYSSLPEAQQNILTKMFFAITRLGHEAVMVFFVLSGFLVGGKVIERISNGTFNPVGYAIDRTVRIMLPLTSSLLLFYGISSYCHIHVPISAWIGSLLSLQGILTPGAFETLWSLSYEVWFYIIMGAMAIFLTRQNNHIVSSLTLLICSLVFTKLKATYLFIWLMGALGYRADSRPNRLLLFCSLILSLIGIAALQITSESNTEIVLTGVSRDVAELLFGFIFAYYISQVIKFKPRYKISYKINNIATQLAAFSYTLYLTHIPVRDLLIYLGAPKSTEITTLSVLLYLLWLAIAMIISYGTYYIFERNTSKVKNYIKAWIGKTHQNRRQA